MRWSYEQDVLCVKRYVWYTIKNDKRSLEECPELCARESFRAVEGCKDINGLLGVIGGDVPEASRKDILKRIRMLRKIFLEWGLDNSDEPKPLPCYTKQLLMAADDYLSYRLKHDIEGTTVETKAQYQKRIKHEIEELRNKELQSGQTIFFGGPEEL